MVIAPGVPDQRASPGAATVPFMTALSSDLTSQDKRFKILDATMKRHRFEPDALLEVLHNAQELFGFLSVDVLRHVGRSLRVPPSRVYGVATFYNFFSLEPKGAHTCVVCMGTACYVKGTAAILGEIERAH